MVCAIILEIFGNLEILWLMRRFNLSQCTMREENDDDDDDDCYLL